ncbi:MAG TPA: DcaP family trimeric outer membrane transporter, partial [Anaeromyxobacter sp.]|nr:DcaP family trimeric outer membrane transporter [Anaeromyxobacter sp.]
KRFNLAIALALALAIPAVSRAADAPGVFKIPGTDSTIKFYGYAQLDTTIDFSGRPDGIENSDWATILPAVPSDNSNYAKHVKPQVYMTARTSRFGIQTNTPTKIGDVGVKVEGDFNGPNGFQSETYTNSVLFRLRHAYGTVGGLLVGQTWSTFLDLNAAPDTVDFNGPGTLALVRNPMIRYTFNLAPAATLALAVENNRGDQYGASSRYQTLPDIHANFGYGGAWGTVSVRGVLQTLNHAYLAGTTYLDQSPKSKEAFGFAVSGSAKVGADTLVAQFAGGPAIGRYLLNSAAIGNDGYPGVSIDSAGSIVLWTMWGVHAGYTHVWNPEFRSNLIGAYSWVQDAKVDGVAATNAVQKDFTQIFANTFYTFAKNAEFGIEYTWGQWKSFTGGGTPEDKGTMNRVNATFHYNFF